MVFSLSVTRIVFLTLLTTTKVLGPPTVSAKQNATDQESTGLSLLITVPLTSNGTHSANPGWMHLAAAVLAVDHFNDRDPAVVPELESLECDVKFSNISVLDTGTSSHMAIRSLMKLLEAGYRPDAIAGAFDELPARELSVAATAMEIPMVCNRGVDQNLVQTDQHPYYSQINADASGGIEFLAEYLKHHGRTNFIAVLYSSEDSTLQRVELLRAILRSKVGADQVEVFSYISPSKPSLMTPDRTIFKALERIKETGFRTLILFTGSPTEDTPDMTSAAAELGMDQGDHFYIIMGGLEASSFNHNQVLIDQLAVLNGGWLRGAAFTYQIEPFEIKDDNLKSLFRRQNSSFIEKLMQLNPVPNYFVSEWPHYSKNELGLLITNETFPPDNIFQLVGLSYGSAFMYDAVISIGLGACQAKSDESAPFTGETHVAGIRKSEFSGASGRVKFSDQEGNPGSRDWRTVYYGVVNLFPDGLDGNFSRYSEYFDPQQRKWIEVNEFVYNDGTNSPPLPLRDTPEQNYLSHGVRIFGLCLMSMALFKVLFSVVWVHWNRHHMVIVAAQPPFLYVLFFGATIISLAIFVVSFDESYGWDAAMLSRNCVAQPWLICIGHMVIYSALFTKLWRVNRVLQFRRRQINVSQVVWPAALVIVSAVIILSVWTATGDYQWERYEIDSVSGESIGRCKGETTIYFLIPVLLLTCIPTLLTCFMAYKTSDVDDMYSESKWIFTLVLVQMQVIVVGLPVVGILETVSTDGRYVGQVLLIWTMPVTTISLIVGPKMMAVWKSRLGCEDRSKSKRGSSEGIRVTGLSQPLKSSLQQSTQVTADSNPLAINEPSSAQVDESRVQTVTME